MSSMTPPAVSGAGCPQRAQAWHSPVLGSVTAAIDSCRDVTVDSGAVERTARWLAWQEYPSLEPARPAPDRIEEQIDLALVTTAINFAYTDFDTGVPWSVTHEGRELVDADAMLLRFDQAIAAGVPLTDGAYLAELDAEQLGSVLHGPRPIPMLAERVQILRSVGRRLVAHHGGSFATLVHGGPPRCYADGQGLVERLVRDVPEAFDDAAMLHGRPVRLDKLVQLGVWTLHREGLVELEDLDMLTAFADYIVPAALRAMGVLVYSERLAAAVDGGALLPSGSDREVEIRAATVYATALLTDAINAIRPAGLRIVIPQLDYRLWADFHSLIRPHHLTRTTRY